MLDRASCYVNVSVSIGSISFRFRSEPPPLRIEAQHGRDVDVSMFHKYHSRTSRDALVENLVNPGTTT